jgi:bifunctional oligoribonuclease and PAP phosphatase NrnA
MSLSVKRKLKKDLRIANFQSLKAEIKQAKNVLISTHYLPDGDGLGAELALFHYLRKAKKKCTILNSDPTPLRYAFLDPKNHFLNSPILPRKGSAKPEQLYDLWLIVDTNDPNRVGELWELYSTRVKKIVFLDHHIEPKGSTKRQYPPNAFLVSDPRSSSIGELLYCLFNELNFSSIDKKIALGLYVSVMTDTNSFRYSGTTPLAHQIAGEMIQLGVNPEEIYQAIYSSKKVSHLQHLGVMLQDVQLSADGKIAWIKTDLNLRKKYRTSADDTQSFLNLLLLIKEAEVICLFREEDDGRIRVSIRSKGKISIHQLATDLGGGGHKYSAGLAITSSLNEAVKRVIEKLERRVESHFLNRRKKI